MFVILFARAYVHRTYSIRMHHYQHTTHNKHCQFVALRRALCLLNADAKTEKHGACRAINKWTFQLHFTDGLDGHQRLVSGAIAQTNISDSRFSLWFRYEFFRFSFSVSLFAVFSNYRKLRRVNSNDTQAHHAGMMNIGSVWLKQFSSLWKKKKNKPKIYKIDHWDLLLLQCCNLQRGSCVCACAHYFGMAWHAKTTNCKLHTKSKIGLD